VRAAAALLARAAGERFLDAGAGRLLRAFGEPAARRAALRALVAVPADGALGVTAKRARAVVAHGLARDRAFVAVRFGRCRIVIALA